MILNSFFILLYLILKISGLFLLNNGFHRDKLWQKVLGFIFLFALPIYRCIISFFE